MQKFPSFEQQLIPFEYPKQVSQLEAPIAPEYFPAAQLVQDTDPARDENRPTAQTLHFVGFELEEYIPVGHDRHTEEDVAPVVVEKVPAGQLAHAEDETASRYEPAVQVSWQDDAVAAETNRAEQAVHMTLPGAE